MYFTHVPARPPFEKGAWRFFPNVRTSLSGYLHLLGKARGYRTVYLLFCAPTWSLQLYRKRVEGLPLTPGTCRCARRRTVERSEKYPGNYYYINTVVLCNLSAPSIFGSNSSTITWSPTRLAPKAYCSPNHCQYSKKLKAFLTSSRLDGGHGYYYIIVYYYSIIV